MNKQELEAFDKTFQTVLQDIITDKDAPKNTCVQEWAKQVIEYNVPHGKKSRGMAVVNTFKLMNKYNDMKEEDIELARILGWIVELFQTYFLVYDDIIDQSITRRGQPCWYKKEGIGMRALNDGILIDEAQHLVLKKHFSGKEYYVKLMDLLHQTSLYTSYGQYMDCISNPPNQRPNFELFTESRYKKIVKYKTSFYTVVLPVRLGLYMSSCDSIEEHKIAEQILLKIGELGQIQDDILDCYGDPKVIGKVGTDIEEGKCSWLAFMALKLANDSDQKDFKDNIGVKNIESVKKVKDIYAKLGLKHMFEQLEEKIYKEICELVEDLKTQKSKLDPQIFLWYLNRLYKRKF